MSSSSDEYSSEYSDSDESELSEPVVVDEERLHVINGIRKLAEDRRAAVERNRKRRARRRREAKSRTPVEYSRTGRPAPRRREEVETADSEWHVGCFKGWEGPDSPGIVGLTETGRVIGWDEAVDGPFPEELRQDYTNIWAQAVTNSKESEKESENADEGEGEGDGGDTASSSAAGGKDASRPAQGEAEGVAKDEQGESEGKSQPPRGRRGSPRRRAKAGKQPPQHRSSQGKPQPRPRADVPVTSTQQGLPALAAADRPPVNRGRSPLVPSRSPVNHSRSPVNHSRSPVNHSRSPVNPSRSPVNAMAGGQQRGSPAPSRSPTSQVHSYLQERLTAAAVAHAEGGRGSITVDTSPSPQRQQRLRSNSPSPSKSLSKAGSQLGVRARVNKPRGPKVPLQRQVLQAPELPFEGVSASRSPANRRPTSPIRTASLSQASKSRRQAADARSQPAAAAVSRVTVDFSLPSHITTELRTVEVEPVARYNAQTPAQLAAAKAASERRQQLRARSDRSQAEGPEGQQGLSLAEWLAFQKRHPERAAMMRPVAAAAGVGDGSSPRSSSSPRSRISPPPPAAAPGPRYVFGRAVGGSSSATDLRHRRSSGASGADARLPPRHREESKEMGTGPTDAGIAPRVIVANTTKLRRRSRQGKAVGGGGKESETSQWLKVSRQSSVHHRREVSAPALPMLSQHASASASRLPRGGGQHGEMQAFAFAQLGSEQAAVTMVKPDRSPIKYPYRDKRMRHRQQPQPLRAGHTRRGGPGGTPFIPTSSHGGSVARALEMARMQASGRM